MGPRLFVRCLGEPVILDRHRQPITLRTDKHLALVLFLVIESRHRATRERLRRMLWPNGKAAQSLSQAISEIRRALGEDVFEVTTNHIALHRNVDIETDLALLRTGSAELMIRELSQSFWGHVLFDGMEIEDAEEWNAWLQLERQVCCDRVARVAEAALHGPSSEIGAAERNRLQQWLNRLQDGQNLPPAPAPARLGWSDADHRVFELSQVLVDFPRNPVLYVFGDNPEDALAVTIAAAQRQLGKIAVDEVALNGTLDHTLLAAKCLLGMPGSAGADPEKFALLRRLVDGVPGSPYNHRADIEAALPDLVESVLDCTHVLLVARGRMPAGIHALRATPNRMHQLWLIELRETEDLQNEQARLDHEFDVRIPPLTLTQLLESSALLSMGRARANLSLVEAGKAAEGSCAVLCVLLGRLAAVTETGITVSNGSPSKECLVDRIRRETNLPEGMANTLAARVFRSLSESNAERPSATSGKRSPTAPSAMKEVSLLDIMTSEPGRLLEDLENSVQRGYIGGPSANAALMAARTFLGLSHTGVVGATISSRVEETARNGGQLEPIEAAVYAILLSMPAIQDATPLAADPFATRVPGKEGSATLLRHIARLISAQATRRTANESEALRDIMQFSPSTTEDKRTAEWAFRFGSAVRDLRSGQYSTAHAHTTHLVGLAAQKPGSSARNALSLRLMTAFRLGRYEEAASISYHLGPVTLRSRARALCPFALMVLRARQQVGDSRGAQILRDMLDEVYLDATSARAQMLGAAYLESIGCRRRATLLAEAAIQKTGLEAIHAEQGLWTRWAKQALQDRDFSEAIERMADNDAPIDARDRILVYRAARERSIGTRSLEHKGFHSARIPEIALR